MKRFQVAIAAATAYLLLYCIAIKAGASLAWVSGLFGGSPVIVCWMVYEILRHAPYHGKALKEEQEFGYEDR